MSRLFPSEPSSEALELRAKLAAMTAPPVDPDTIPRRRRIIQIAFEPRIQRALARHAPDIRTITIGGVSSLEITVPGMRQQTEGARPTILYFFGGGHLGGDARQDSPITVPLAAFSGARIIAPNYRTAPENPWPAGLNDAETVYRALLEETGGRLVLAGESAGAHLAMTLIIRARAKGLAMPAAAALMSPWSDLTEQGDPEIAEAGLDPTLHTGYLNVAARLYAGVHDRANPEISPLYAAFDANFPPVLITSGTRDRLRIDSEALSNRLREAGIPVEFHLWPGLWHVFEFYDELPEAAASLRSIAAFLMERLDARR